MIVKGGVDHFNEVSLIFIPPILNNKSIPAQMATLKNNGANDKIDDG